MTIKNHDSRSLNQGSPPFTFHPFEVAFCGYSNSGKTTLITKILDRLKLDYSLAFIKNDVHGFDMDREDKDTHKAWRAGSSHIFISDKNHFAQIKRGETDVIDRRLAFLDSDFVIMEGFRESEVSKIIMIDGQSHILDAVMSGAITNIIAFVGPAEDLASPLPDVPYFHRDDVEALAFFISHWVRVRAHSAPLYGLVLAGGRSTRMKTDKALLKYQDKPQAEICVEILSKFCGASFLSSRTNQWSHGPFDHLNQINDTFLDIGPLGGILSAMQKMTYAAWIVVACDLPNLDQDTIETLIAARDPLKFATCYQSSRDGYPEPLCAIYEPKMFMRMMQFLALGIRCPRKILLNSEIKMIDQTRPNSLDNINTRDEYSAIINQYSQNCEVKL